MGRSRERRTSEIRVSLEGLQSMSGAYTSRDVFTNTIDTVSENNAGCELTRQKQRSRVRPHHNCNSRTHTILARGCPPRFACRTTRTRRVVWRKTERRRSVVAPTPCEYLGKSELPPTPGRSECFRNVETNTHIIIHVDDCSGRAVKF